jgi:hypothetical protein
MTSGGPTSTLTTSCRCSAPECTEREFGGSARLQNLVPNLVPTSAHLTASQRAEAGPKPRFRSQVGLPAPFKTI